MVPRLSDGVVVLDELKLDDLPAHLAGEDEEQARRFGWHPRRSTEETGREAIIRWRDDWMHGGDTRTFAIRLAGSGELAGGLQLRLREKKIAEASYWTFPQHRRRGLATRAMRLASLFAFSELGIDRLELYVEPDNVASHGVARNAGFSKEGQLRARELTVAGERRDMVLYARLATD